MSKHNLMGSPTRYNQLMAELKTLQEREEKVDIQIAELKAERSTIWVQIERVESEIDEACEE